MWEIVGVSKVPILYIYIYIYLYRCVLSSLTWIVSPTINLNSGIHSYVRGGIRIYTNCILPSCFSFFFSFLFYFHVKKFKYIICFFYDWFLTKNLLLKSLPIWGLNFLLEQIIFWTLTLRVCLETAYFAKTENFLLKIL